MQSLSTSKVIDVKAPPIIITDDMLSPQKLDTVYDEGEQRYKTSQLKIRTRKNRNKQPKSL